MSDKKMIELGKRLYRAQVAIENLDNENDCLAFQHMLAEIENNALKTSFEAIKIVVDAMRKYAIECNDEVLIRTLKEADNPLASFPGTTEFKAVKQCPHCKKVI
jgi:hypothetical protein